MIILILYLVFSFPIYNGSIISVKHNDNPCVYDNVEKVFKLVNFTDDTRYSQVYFHGNEQILYVKIDDVTWFLSYKENSKRDPLQVTFEKQEDSCTVTLGNGTYLAAYKPHYSNGDLLPQLDYYFLGHDPNSNIVKWYPEKILENNDIITWKLPSNELWEIVLHFEYLYHYANASQNLQNITPVTELYYHPDYGVSLNHSSKLSKKAPLEFSNNCWHRDGKWLSISPTHRVGSDGKRVTLVLVGFVKHSAPTNFTLSENALYYISNEHKSRLVSVSFPNDTYLTLLEPVHI